jgi:hypothetical protein
MTLSEMLDAVVSRSKRPDRKEEILLAIQEATLFCHNFDFFRRDMYEVPISYVSVGGLQTAQLIYADVLPSFRKIAYWRKWDPVSLVAGKFLSPVEPDAIFDAYNCKKQDIYYVASRVINWYSSTVDQAHIIGYWRFPNVSKSRYESWIAEQSPFCIINRALGKVFRTIGQPDEARAALQDSNEELMQLQTNEIESQGR